MYIETMISVVNTLFFGLIILTPIVLRIVLKRFQDKRIRILYFLVSLLLSGILIYNFAWWGDKSDLILLHHYGYNLDGWTDLERYQNVDFKNMGKVKRLETDIMGIDWPLKAVFGYVTILPYVVMIFLVNIWIEKTKTVQPPHSSQ